MHLDMPQNRIRKPTNITLDPELLAALDAWVAEQRPKTTRTAAIEEAIEEYLRARQSSDGRGGK